MNRTLFFETLSFSDWPLVQWSLLRGDRVCVFDFSYHLKRIGWVRKLLRAGKIERIYIHNGSQADGLAIEAAEWIFPRFEQHPLIRGMGRLLGPEEVGFPFKYALVQELSRAIYLTLHVARQMETGRCAWARIVSPAFQRWETVLKPWAQDRLPDLSRVARPRIANVWVRAGSGWRERGPLLKRYLGCGFYLSVILLGRFFQQKKISPDRSGSAREARFAIAIDSAFQAKFSGPRRFNFLLDGRRITAENTLFLVGPAGEGAWMEQARQAGYRVIRRRDWGGLRGGIRRPARSLPVREVLSCLWGRLCSVYLPHWMDEAAALGLWTMVQEKSLLEHIRFRHFIYSNTYGLLPRWRNILIRREGADVWWYAYSSGGPFTRNGGGAFSSDRDFGGVFRLWCYENADHFVSPCVPLISYFRQHRQRIRFYHDVGNLWSEPIRQMETGSAREKKLRDWFGPLRDGPRKVIAWFDTSFAEAANSSATFQEGVRWYNDLLRLAEEQPELLMVIKPSKNDAYYIQDSADQQWSVPDTGRKLLDLWALLRRHPRVRFLDRSADPTEVIAVSDLTVTYPYTSVSAEAIGAGKRGIWYEPGQRWTGTLYAREPRLVAHGYEQLRALVRTLLWEMDDEAYRRFLEGEICRQVDSFMDGRGISRFRSLLTGTEEVSGGPAPAALHEAVGALRRE